MSQIQGLNPQLVQQRQASETGETAQVTSQQQTRLYENNIQLSRADAPPPDVDSSFAPVLDGPRATDTRSNGQVYDRFNQTTDDFAVGLTSLLATLLHETGQEIRRSTRNGRSANIQAQASLQRQQAEEIRDGAALQLAGAVVGGSVQIAAAGASAGGAIGSYRQASQAGALGQQAQQAGVTDAQRTNLINQQQALNNNATALNGLGQATGQGFGGLGSIVSAPLNYAAQLTEAERTELEAQRTELQQGQTELNDLNQQVQDFLREVRQRLGEIQNSENQVVSRIYSV